MSDYAKKILRCGNSLWPEMTILTAVAIAFRPTLIGSAHLPFDIEFYHYPLLRTVQEQLFSGRIPAWDPYSYGGIPLLANAQSAWLYPPHLVLDGILTVAGQPLTEHALDVVEILHVAIAGLGTAAVARGRRLGPAAAAFAGIFVVLNGETIAQTQHLGMVETFAWVPLAIFVIDRIREDGATAPRIVTLGVLFALMITAGFLPLVTACAALLVGVGLAQGPRRLRTLLSVIAGIALGIVMAAAALMPVLAVLRTFPLLEPHGSLLTSGLVTAIFPNVFGQWGASLAEYTGTELTNTYFYVGASVLVLLPLALSSGRRVFGEVILIVVLLFASFGTPGSHIAQAIQSLPTVGLLWRPEDVIYLVTIPLGLLLARGLSRAPSARQLAFSALTVIGFGLVRFSGHGHGLNLFANTPRRSLLALLLVAVCVLVASILHARGRAVALALALGAIIAGADLASAVPHRFFVNAPGASTSAGINATGDGSRVLGALRSQITPDGRIDADLNSLPAEWAGFPSVWHLSDVNGFQPQFSKYQLARVKDTGVDFEGRNRTFPVAPGVRAYFEELNVQYVVVSSIHDRFAGIKGYAPGFQDASYHVYHVGGRESRAYAVSESCLHSRSNIELLACRTGPAIRTVVTGPSTRHMLIESPTNVPLLVITGDPWYPGWRATSSSGPLPVHRIGYLTAVSVPRGTTQVQLTYHAPGLLLGGMLSVLAVGGSLFALAYDRRRRGRRVSHSTKVRGSMGIQ